MTAPQERTSLFPSRGEQLAGRELEKEIVAGVEHYKPGQHEAEIVVPNGSDFFSGEPEQIARLTYVDQMGHACIVLCSRQDENEAWRPTWIGRAGQVTEQRAVRAPEGFVLSEKMLAALAVAPVKPDEDVLNV